MHESTLLIAGYGVSGQGAARLASALKLPYYIVDERDTPEMHAAASALNPPPLGFCTGWKPGIPLPQCDEVLLSPGIRLSSPFGTALRAAAKNGKCSGELSFALRSIRCPVVMITGTNGKTTTTELANVLFQAAGMRSAAAGNIGVSLSDSAVEALRDGLDLLVVEVSSFQLESMDPFTPAAAAVLNLAGDHLDRHGSMHEYAATKFRVFGELRKNCVLASSLKTYAGEFLNPAADLITFSVSDPSATFYSDSEQIFFRGTPLMKTAPFQLRGKHNLENIMAALALLYALLGEEVLHRPAVREALACFKPDAHRIELFLEQNGIRYVNDSKATNPHAVNAALDCVGGDKNVILILGGLDKGMDFSELLPSVGKMKMACLIGEAARRIEETLSPFVQCIRCGSLEEAVSAACERAVSGDVVLLSPAAASMDMFRNYRERGECFKKAILEYCASGKRNACS